MATASRTVTNTTDGTASTASSMEGYTDGNANPTTKVQRFYATTGLAPNTGGSIMFPVKKNDYWKIVVSNVTPTVYWIPLGS